MERFAWFQGFAGLLGKALPLGRFLGTLQKVRKRALDAPIAQLDRAVDYESTGREFESLWAHHSHLLADRPSKLTVYAGFLPAWNAELGPHSPCGLGFCVANASFSANLDQRRI